MGKIFIKYLVIVLIIVFPGCKSYVSSIVKTSCQNGCDMSHNNKIDRCRREKERSKVCLEKAAKANADCHLGCTKASDDFASSEDSMIRPKLAKLTPQEEAQIKKNTAIYSTLSYQSLGTGIGLEFMGFDPISVFFNYYSEKSGLKNAVLDNTLNTNFSGYEYLFGVKYYFSHWLTKSSPFYSSFYFSFIISENHMAVESKVNGATGNVDMQSILLTWGMRSQFELFFIEVSLGIGKTRNFDSSFDVKYPENDQASVEALADPLLGYRVGGYLSFGVAF